MKREGRAGRCPEPRLFLEKKEGKKNSRKHRFRQGIIDFAEIHFRLAGENEIFRKYISAWQGK